MPFPTDPLDYGDTEDELTYCCVCGGPIAVADNFFAFYHGKKYLFDTKDCREAFEVYPERG